MKSLILIITLMLSCLAMTVFAAYPVVPIAPEAQALLLESDNPQLAANKRHTYKFYRLMEAGHFDEMVELMHPNFKNHDPRIEKGVEAFVSYVKAYLARLGIEEPQPVKDTLDGVLSIVAERDLVIITFATSHDNPLVLGEKYTTTWFDMFRIKDGLIVEYWNPDKIPEE